MVEWGASRLRSMCTAARYSNRVLLASKCSYSFARRRFRDHHARVRSTTQRRASRTKPFASGGRVTISNSTPKVSRSQATRSPRSPWSAHTLSKRGKCGTSCASSARPPSCSVQSAGTTNTPKTCPSVSTSTKRFRPTTFFAAVVPPFAAALGGPGRLAVDDRGAGLRPPPQPFTIGRTQRRVDPHPGAVPHPQVVVIAHGAPMREVVRPLPPLAAGPQQVEDCVDHFPQVHRARTPGPGSLTQPRVQQGPLRVRQVGGVGPARRCNGHLILHLHPVPWNSLQDPGLVPLPCLSYQTRSKKRLASCNARHASRLAGRQAHGCCGSPRRLQPGKMPAERGP